ncbi:tape measure protein [Chitinophaga sp. LS1]|uniref:tape measure protein n=1 Tax=Chitinophaga sp. LS1 TaxID=3051176 RepID=UPI002AABC32A|nr:tape measure protein [Chitinophaga sp. LS1]WPV66587.1 tape measure protein [Chitinophaga sp. LS1]
MADLTTITTDTYKDLLKAADAAFGKIGTWMKNTIDDNNIFVASNKKLGASLGDIEDKFKRIEDLKKKTTSPFTIARLDKIELKWEEDKKDIQDRSDFLNKKGWKENITKKTDAGLDKMIKASPDLLEMGMAAEKAQLGFQRLTGSSTAAANILKDIHQMAATSFFDNDKLQENAKTLLESGVAAEKLMPAMNMLGDVSGSNQAKMDSLTKAFGDMQQVGHLTEDSLKAMNEAGFKPLELMAANGSQSIEELKASMAAGGVSTESVVAALQTATSKGGEFFGVMKEQSETATGKWHYLQEKMSEAGGTIGNALMPTVSNFIDNTLIPLVGWLSAAAGWIAENSELVGFLTTVVAGVVLGYKAWTLAAELLGPAMMASGIGAIFVAVGALIGIIIYAWNTFGWFRGGIMAAWEVLKTFGQFIWDYTIEPIKDLLSGLWGLAKTVWYVFSGDWGKAMESGQQAIDGLTFSGTAAAMKKDVNDIMGLGDKVADTFNAEVNKKKDQANAGPGNGSSGSWQGNFGGGSASGTGASYSSLPPLPPGKGTDKAPVVSFEPDATRKKMSMDNTKDTVSGITTGGARTVNITLQKLFETINITTNTVGEGITNMEQQVTDALLNILKQA